MLNKLEIKGKQHHKIRDRRRHSTLSQNFGSNFQRDHVDEPTTPWIEWGSKSRSAFARVVLYRRLSLDWSSSITRAAPPLLPLLNFKVKSNSYTAKDWLTIYTHIIHIFNYLVTSGKIKGLLQLKSLGFYYLNLVQSCS